MPCPAGQTPPCAKHVDTLINKYHPDTPYNTIGATSDAMECIQAVASRMGCTEDPTDWLPADKWASASIWSVIHIAQWHALDPSDAARSKCFSSDKSRWPLGNTSELVWCRGQVTLFVVLIRLMLAASTADGCLKCKVVQGGPAIAHE